MRSRLKELIAQKEAEFGRRIQNIEIARETGLSENAISRWMSPEPFLKIEVSAALKLCNYLRCEFGDLLYIDYMETA